MTGAVVAAVADATSNQSGAASGRKRKAGAPKAAAAKPKRAKAKAAPSAEQTFNLPPEPKLDAVTVDCQYGVRNKLWVDSLMACALHTVRSLYAQFGDVVEQDLLDRVKIDIVRLGLRFAFLGDASVQTAKQTKKYTKWSALRPALQAHGVFLLTQAGKNFLNEILNTFGSNLNHLEPNQHTDRALGKCGYVMQLC